MSGSVRLVSGEQLSPYVDGIRAVYADAFGAPPWHEEPALAHTCLIRLAQDARRPGFLAALALDRGAVLGFATGWTTPRRSRPAAATPRRPPP
ncbi:hypothetical protein [Streptomyces sp. NPDC048196]|uniref:hypothetical protein n=1 Tax=Streptomyces sp. NPDC048196 TaxID=3154712 RepID=UPI0033E21CA7